VRGKRQVASTARRKPARKRGIPEFPPGPSFTPADMWSISVHDCSIGYAADVLHDFGLADWSWLTHDLAETMDDAAMSAAHHWILDHRAELENAACWPRWCPCGKWPDFGVGCPYHGPCRCVERKVVDANLQGPCYSDLFLTVSTYGWRPDWRAWGHHDAPALNRSCPVHPDGPLPDDVLAAWWHWHQRGGSLRIGGERGLPAYTSPASKQAARG
jgi:hypothetical protein